MSDKAKPSRRKVKEGIGQRIGPWQVLMNWPGDEDQGGPVSMTITPAADATDDELIGGLSSTWLRQIDFRAAREKWVLWRASTPSITPEEAARHRAEATRFLAEQLQEILARDGVSDGYLGYLAEAYTFLVRSGERSVAGKLAEMTGRSPDTMKQHLHRVRKAGMLTAVSGKAGGQLTDKAYEAIRQADRAKT
jgi:hypothetical protein